MEKNQVRMLFQGLLCRMWSEKLGEYWWHMKIHRVEKSNHLLQDIKSGNEILLRVWELLSYYWVSDLVVFGIGRRCVSQAGVLFQGLLCHMWSGGIWWIVVAYIQHCYPLNFTFYEISINACGSSESLSVSGQIHCYHEMPSLYLSGFIVKTCWHTSQGEC